MRLFTGPAGSGKTYRVLQEFRDALRSGDCHARLLVPTATMARHLRNLLAREGLVFAANQVATLHRYLSGFAPEARAISDPALYVITEEALRAAVPQEFARVAGMPGFCASLSRAIDELSSAGCDAAALSRSLPETPLGPAFLQAYREVERAVEARGFCLRGRRMARVAAALRERGPAPSAPLWLDGFTSFTEPEFEILAAWAAASPLTVTLTDAPVTRSARERLLRLGFAEHVCAFAPPRPQVTLVEAPTIERECDEIARRILAYPGEFRDIGVIVRSPEVYEPVLRLTMERFGVPARFYFERPLLEAAPAAYVAAAVEAMLSGWDYEKTLAWLRTAPNGTGARLDGFDFAVRRKLPARGLEGLRALAGENAGLSDLLEAAGRIESWREERSRPADWAERLESAARLYRPRPAPASMSHEFALAWREQAAALSGFCAAMREAAECFSSGASVPFTAFWEIASAVLRVAVLRADDLRRNVVNVLTAYEARQWRLPVVFVCGLVEKQFPKYRPQDLFFPDTARRALQQAGIRLRTTAELDEEEKFLFDSAMTRATDALVLTFPRADAQGGQNLRSLFVAGMDAVPAPAVSPVRALANAGAPGSIQAPALLIRIAERHQVMKPTALESFVQCPFQFFARHTLRLEEPPARPEQRLDARVAGNLVHQTIREWSASREPIDDVFGRLFEAAAVKENIPAGYRRAAVRTRLLDDLRRFAADTQWPGGFDSAAEVDFEYDLDGVRIKGRIDRLDRAPDGQAYIIDYKYSERDYSKDESLLQGPLYLLAAERAFGGRPGGMYYCALRRDVQYRGWSADGAPIGARPMTRDWQENAIAAALRAAEEIRAGRIAPDPQDRDKCRYCAYRDLCRVEAAEAARAEGA
jgi:ATP-dependent helicase/nuclease subunit B